MIYSIERRKISGGGSLETVYEVRSYKRIADCGALIGGRTLKTVKTKKAAEGIMRRRGLTSLGPLAGVGEIYVHQTTEEGE